MKRYLIYLFCFSFLTTYAQTVVWQMKPMDYSEITIVNKNLYKVVRNGKIGFIHSDGTVVAQTENDNISLFYEGKALVTATDNIGERVYGCLTEDGQYYKFVNKYYTLNGQKFFSDGVLSVSNEQGKLGYIDEKGIEVCGFDGKYDRIKPFSEGYASVFKNKKYYLVDKDWNTVKFRFKTVGEVYGGTNVYKGLVYIWDTEGKFYTFDVNQNDYCKSLKKAINTKSLDYLYRFSSITGLNKDIPYSRKDYTGTRGRISSQKDGMYGYVSAENVILPFQFHYASEFIDGNAVVGQDGRLGIIRIVEGNSFAVTEISNNLNFYRGKPTTCQFTIDVPEIWKNSNCRIELKDVNGQSIETKLVGNTYTFIQNLSSTCTKNFSVEIYGEGLKLFEGQISYSFKLKEVCSVCGKDKDRCSGHTVEKTKPKYETCRTCHKKLSECPYQGEH